MNPRVRAVQPAENYTLWVLFNNGELRLFDVTPYLEKGFFQELKHVGYFAAVTVFLGSIQWPHGQDFCPDSLYVEGQKSEPPAGVKAWAAEQMGVTQSFTPQLAPPL